MDKRDEIQWAILELSPQGERIVEDDMERLSSEIRRILRVDETWKVFIPSKSFEKNGERITIHLMEGYCFVASGLDEIKYFKLENSTFIAKVMSGRDPKTKMRVLHVISNNQVQELRRRLEGEVSRDVETGMRVSPSQGVFSSIEGEIVEVKESEAQVLFEFESCKVLQWFPKVFLRIL